MGQVAFDTQEFVETLENAGLPKDQARAISIAVGPVGAKLRFDDI